LIWLSICISACSAEQPIATLADGGAVLDVGASFDGGAILDAEIGDAGVEPAPSRCTVTADRAECTKRSMTLSALLVPRTVTWELPLGTPPAAGWPTVIFFQGTTVAGSEAFAADHDATFGQYRLTRTVKALLDRGFAVVAPNALIGGATAWETNIPPWSVAWATSSDHLLMLELFRALDAAELGPIDSDRLYAMGISSGGFMTSRMAVSYPGRFRGLAVHSGSYATCSAICVLPRDLPADHPPTLFLHGQADSTMPIASMIPYREALIAMGIVVASDIDPVAGHEWIEGGVSSVPAWFEQH
jgi:poly(3-hydroxyoctanoate) depolymerase